LPNSTLFCVFVLLYLLVFAKGNRKASRRNQQGIHRPIESQETSVMSLSGVRLQVQKSDDADILEHEG
jgi:hypothetical protein